MTDVPGTSALARPGLAIIHHTKNGERRAVAIIGLADEVMRSWYRRQRLDTDLVFLSLRGNTNSPQRAWEEAREAAGIDDFRWHDLRHTFA